MTGTISVWGLQTTAKTHSKEVQRNARLSYYFLLEKQRGGTLKFY